MPNPSHILALRFEGLGKPAASASDKRYRFSTAPSSPTWDSDGLYLTDTIRELPGEIGFGVDFREGRSSIGGLTFTLLATERVREAFYYSAPAFLAKLTEGVNAGATAVKLDTGSLTGSTVVLGREVIYLGTESPSLTYTATRGVLKSVAQSHGTSGVTISGEDGIDVDVYDANLGGAMRVPGRRVDLVRTTWGASGYSDETVLWQGVVVDIDAPTPDAIQITCNGGLDLLKGKICTKLWRGTLQEDPSSAEGDQRAHTYVDPSRKDTVASNAGTRTLYSWGGKALVSDQATVNARVQIADDGDPLYLTGDGARIDWNGQPPKQIWQCYSTDPGAPDLGASGIKLSPNLAELSLQIMTTSERGDNYDSLGGGSNYDLGVADPLNADVGLDIPWDLIDTAAFEDIRREFGAGTGDGAGSLLYRPRIHPGADGKPVDAYELLQREWHSISCVLTVGSGGKVTVVRLADVAGQSATTITQADLRDVPRQRRRMTDALDRVSIEYDDLPGVGTRTDTFDDVFNRRRSIRARNRFDELRAPGLADEGLARDIALAFVGGYHEPIPEIQIVTGTDVDVWPGEVVRLTGDFYFNRDGSWGLTSRSCLITGRQYSTARDEVTYVLLDVSSIFNRAAWWAPSGQIATVPTTTTMTLTTNYFTTGRGPYSTDLAAFEAALDAATAASQTLKVDVLDNADLSVVTAGLSVSSIVGTTITTGSVHGAGAADILVLSSYDEQGSAVQALFASMADPADDKLGAANDDGYQWTR